jgi:hypothetical protein
MIDYKKCLYRRYVPVISGMNTTLQKKIQIVYDQAHGFIEETALLEYVVGAAKAREAGTDLSKVLGEIRDLAGQPIGRNASDRDVVEAIQVMQVYSRMNREVVGFKRDNPDKPLPFVIFEPCYWYFDALKLVESVKKEDYPLIQDWRVFFMLLPVNTDRDRIGKDGVLKIRMVDYEWLVRQGRISDYYAKFFGYRAGENYQILYSAELSNMSPKELEAEIAKRGWGAGMAKVEMGRRV